MSTSQPYLVVERPYAVSQSERADAKHLCQCPSEGARFASNADRLRALRAKYVGQCCGGSGQTAKLYGDVPKTVDAQPCCYRS
jgi:hypothetical protein